VQISLGPYRRSLRRYESAFAYAVLGIVGGLASGLAVMAFEYAIHGLAGLWQVSRAENFETLPRLWIFALPTLGGIVLGLAFSLLRPEDREVGLTHLVSRLHSHYGVLPLRNALVQFFGGVVALASGQSGGREGPGVHLGGASACPTAAVAPSTACWGRRWRCPTAACVCSLPAAPQGALPPPSIRLWRG